MARDSQPASAASMQRVSIRPGVSVLAVLRHLNYKPWFALAEFDRDRPPAAWRALES